MGTIFVGTGSWKMLFKIYMIRMWSNWNVKSWVDIVQFYVFTLITHIFHGVRTYWETRAQAQGATGNLHIQVGSQRNKYILD